MKFKMKKYIMKKQIKIISGLFLLSLLCGCQELNSDLEQINSLSNLTGQSNSSNYPSLTPSHSSISNPWGVTNSEAMTWLSHNNITWNANGKLQGVNWYNFWSQQIHNQTVLAKNAYNYCHVDSWNTQQVGANCQTYWRAYSMTKSEESRSFGQTLETSE